MARSSDGQNGAYCGRLDDRREGFPEIDAGTLGETPDNPAGFLPVQGAVGVKFVFENPLPGDDVCVGWAINKAPSAVGLKGAKLLLHGSMPIGISEHGVHQGWKGKDLIIWRRGDRGLHGEGIARIGFEDARIGTRDHRMSRQDNKCW